MHKRNCFITLTFNNEHLPGDRSVNKRHLQLFFKRLRKKLPGEIRYFACGEYGEQKNRPHYHALIFGYDFPDKELFSTRDGIPLYTSKLLQTVWPFGFSTIGEATFESAAYVARYVMKKRKGDPDQKDKNGITNAQHYELVDPVTGEVTNLEPEFALMSRRPGIGKDWLVKYKGDTDKDYITVRGQKMSLPKYYDNLLAVWDEEDMAKRKLKRVHSINLKEATDERLAVRKAVKEASLNFLPRKLQDY